MKLVVYSKDEYYFLTEDEFDKAVESWGNGKPILFKSRGIYLPQPRRPVGLPPEHSGLQLAFTFNEEHYGMPGWIGIRKPMIDKKTGEELSTGAVYVRVIDHDQERTRYKWHWINNDMDSDKAKEFIKSLKPIMAEDILKDDDLRSIIPFEPLLTDYFLN